MVCAGRGFAWPLSTSRRRGLDLVESRYEDMLRCCTNIHVNTKAVPIGQLEDADKLVSFCGRAPRPPLRCVRRSTSPRT